jgi:DNA polymerase-3 subunit epsilon
MWWNGRLIGVDLETTAADPERARIVTADVIAVGGGVAREGLSLLVDPGMEVPEGAAAIHGWTREKLLAANARPTAEALPALMAVLESLAGAGHPIIGFNLRYDLTVLDRECRRHGCVPLQEAVPELRAIDPLVIDKQLDRYRSGSRKLPDVCQAYGAHRPDDSAHSSQSDALQAARCAWVLGAKGKAIRRPPRNAHEAQEKRELEEEWARVRGDLRLLHLAQVRWAAEQAASLAEYFAKKGQMDDAESVVAEWPVHQLREVEPA